MLGQILHIKDGKQLQRLFPGQLFLLPVPGQAENKRGGCQ